MIIGDLWEIPVLPIQMQPLFEIAPRVLAFQLQVGMLLSNPVPAMWSEFEVKDCEFEVENVEERQSLPSVSLVHAADRR